MPPPAQAIRPGPPIAAVKPPPAPTRCDGIEALVGNERRFLKPGNSKTDWFKDCPTCPEMVAVRAGRFVMGSPKEEPERDDEREVQMPVMIAKPFAVGRFDIARAEFAAFVAATGHRTEGVVTLGPAAVGSCRPIATGARPASRRRIANHSCASIGSMPRPMPRGCRRPPARPTGFYRKPSASMRPGPARPRPSGGGRASPRSMRTTIAVSHTLAAASASGARRRFRSTCSLPTPGASTMCTATCGNGRRIAGIPATRAIRALAPRGQLTSCAPRSPRTRLRPIHRR